MTIEIGVMGVSSPPVEGVVRAARRAEEAGYDAVWWADHLMGLHHAVWVPDITPLATMVGPHVFLDPVAAITAVALNTERIRLGTCVTDAIRRPPAMLANTWLTLDHVTKGRAILGIGAGEEENIRPYGMDFSRPVSMLEEALAIVRLLWSTDEPVDFDGRFSTLRRAVCGLRPYRPDRTPPIWVAANGPRTLEIAGRYGDGWLPTIVSPQEYAERLAIVRKAAEAAGRDGEAITPGLAHYAILDPSHEEAHRLMNHRIVRGIALTFPSEAYERRGYEHPLGRGHRGISAYVPTDYSREEALRALDAVPEEMLHELMFHGTPDEVVGSIRAYEAAGLRHISLLNIAPLGDPSKTRESFALAETVVAALKS